MADVVDKATRSRMMSGIRGKNTQPELAIRKILHARGFRFRLHAKGLPGKPDLVFPKYKAAIFVHGCFWHGHDCKYFKVPQTRTDFWLEKIGRTRSRDDHQQAELLTLGWKVMTVWECEIRSTKNQNNEALADLIARWLINDASCIQIEKSVSEIPPCSTIKSATTSKALLPNT